MNTSSTVTDTNGNILASVINANIITITLPTGTNNSNFGVIINNIKNSPSLKPSGYFGF